VIASMSIARPSLDDVFLTMTGRSLRDADATTHAAPGGLS
jgi:hypothetical protein